nr:hypothetical protein [Tanacetum cinerariifolium]
MRTRSQFRENFPQQKASPAIVEPLRIENPFLEDQFQEDSPKDPPEVSMTDNRTMVEMLRAPTEGRFNIFGDMLLIQSFSIKKLNLSRGKGESAKSIALGAAVTGTGETKIDEGV